MRSLAEISLLFKFDFVDNSNHLNNLITNPSGPFPFAFARLNALHKQQYINSQVATGLSIFPGLSLSCCCNYFNHSDLDESGPLIGGVIPKSVSKIDLIQFFVKPLLLLSFALYIAITSDNSGSISPSQQTLSQEHYSFVSLPTYQ